MLGKQMILARINHDAGVVVFPLSRICRIHRVALAHVDSQARRENFSRGTEGRLVGNKKQCASAAYPFADRVTLGVRKRWTISAFVINVFSTERVNDH